MKQSKLEKQSLTSTDNSYFLSEIKNANPKELSFKQMRALLTNPEAREITKRIQAINKELSSEVKIFQQNLDDAIQTNNETMQRDKQQKKKLKQMMIGGQNQQKNSKDFL